MKSRPKSTFNKEILQNLIFNQGEAGPDIAGSLQQILIEDTWILIEDRLLQRSWIVPEADFAMVREKGAIQAGMEVTLPLDTGEPLYLKMVP